MDGILIQYQFNGNEQIWQKTVNTFIARISEDADLAGKFHYSVFKTSEPAKRVHVGRWDSDQTLSTLREKEFFKTFTEQMKELAGDSLISVRLQPELETAN